MEERWNRNRYGDGQGHLQWFRQFFWWVRIGSLWQQSLFQRNECHMPMVGNCGRATEQKQARQCSRQSIQVIRVDPKDLTVAGKSALFPRRRWNPRAKELWTSDGTEAGTVMVKDIEQRRYGGSNYADPVHSLW